MAKYGKKTMSKGKKALLILGVIVLLIGLFFLSFWITTLSLRSNQDPGIAPASGSPAASATPAVDYNKLSKKELIALVEEKDEKIRQLEESLASGQTNTQAPIGIGAPISGSVHFLVGFLFVRIFRFGFHTACNHKTGGQNRYSHARAHAKAEAGHDARPHTGAAAAHAAARDSTSCDDPPGCSRGGHGITSWSKN